MMRPIAPTYLVFLHRKCASQESCRVPWAHFPCVFSSKMRLGFTSDCEFTCDAANRSWILYLFSTKTCVAETLPDSMCFFNESASCVRGDCKFTCDAVIAPTFLVFSKENAPRRNPAAFVGFTFLVFSRVIRSCVQK